LGLIFYVMPFLDGSVQDKLVMLGLAGTVGAMPLVLFVLLVNIFRGIYVTLGIIRLELQQILEDFTRSHDEEGKGF
jgi:hypothetical protein